MRCFVIRALLLTVLGLCGLISTAAASETMKYPREECTRPECKNGRAYISVRDFEVKEDVPAHHKKKKKKKKKETAGRAIEKKPATAAQSKKPRSAKTTAAKKPPDKKDDKKKGGGAVAEKQNEKKPAMPLGEGAPSLIEADGIPLDGATIYRGTGKFRDRPAIFCWAMPRGKAPCRRFKYYQFVTVNYRTKWGNGPEQDANADVLDAFKKGITARTGVQILPGELTADDYAVPRDQSMTDPKGKVIKAGEYKQNTIPGTKGRQGHIDAPLWDVAAGVVAFRIAPEELKRKPKLVKQANPPPDIHIGTVKVMQHFRTYAYCSTGCLGYFEWDYNETVDIYWTWAPKEPDLDKMLELNAAKEPPTWEPVLKNNSSIDGPINISKWQKC